MKRKPIRATNRLAFAFTNGVGFDDFGILKPL